MTKWVIRVAVVLALAGMAAGGGIVWVRARLAAPGPSAAVTTVVFAKGEGSRGMARQLNEAGVVESPWLFLAGVKTTGAGALQAGEYAFPAHVSIVALLDMLRRGQVVVHRFTVAEGLTSAQVIQALRQAEALVGTVDAVPGEGSLLPQTYFYHFGDSRASLIQRMQRGMTELLDDVWARRGPGASLADKGQALILASIVERETALSGERPHVAAVFLNRLKLGMKLQSDPTVIYAVSHGEGTLDRDLTRADLALDSPFNTYVAPGLPPTPICNPGRASLEAVLNPQTSDDLYFVADGSGGHSFARTLSDHNRNVARARHQRHDTDDADAPAAQHPQDGK